MAEKYVSHPVYGRGVIQSGGLHTRYTTVRFGTLAMTVPSSELTPVTVSGPVFMTGDRVEHDGRQGTVKAVEFGQVHIAWDNHNETYVYLANAHNFKLLPPLPAGTEVKHKYTIGSGGRTVETPKRGNTHVAVQWSSGLTSTVKLDLLEPVQPQKTQEDERTVDTILAETEAELAKWRETERDAALRVGTLSAQVEFLRSAKSHVELVKSVQKW